MTIIPETLLPPPLDTPGGYAGRYTGFRDSSTPGGYIGASALSSSRDTSKDVGSQCAFEVDHCCTRTQLLVTTHIHSHKLRLHEAEEPLVTVMLQIVSTLTSRPCIARAQPIRCGYATE